jgi:hypothetical protein
MVNLMGQNMLQHTYNELMVFYKGLCYSDFVLNDYSEKLIYTAAGVGKCPRIL